MKSKLTKILISFIVMISFNILFSPMIFLELGITSPHVGLLFVLGLLFGPYGALGAVMGNIVIDLIGGFTPMQILPSGIFSFGVSYLAYKLWYSGFKTDKITKPKLDNSYHITLFLSSIMLCGIIYSIAHGNLMDFIIDTDIFDFTFISYFLNFINVALFFGIIGIWICEKIDFVETPKKSKRPVNKRLYNILFYLLIVISLIALLSFIIEINLKIIMAELILLGIVLFSYLTKPFEYDIEHSPKHSITEKIMHKFLLITLVLMVIGIIISILSYGFITHTEDLNLYLYIMPALIIIDVIIILSFIPGIIILRYVEQKVIKPISSFSEIEDFISENEKIEAEGLIEVYSKYIDEKTEIGTLARSYTNLINHNNHYIENIREIEGEKERINAELDIATGIQEAALPIEAIENDDFIVDGYSHPAKEVGGDFFDYYMIDDDNLVIAIGDASGKGVPAALLAMITQVIIKQLLKHDQDPSNVLCSLNDQLSENNSESMFITLWLGIYNKTTKKLIFSNAGHNPPLIKENGKFKYLEIDTGIVLGIMEGFDYVKEEITLTEELVIYTDGITDANNANNEMYGEDRLLEFFNSFKSDADPITPLLNDIHDFTKNEEQFDDMTLVYLRDKS